MWDFEHTLRTGRERKNREIDGQIPVLEKISRSKKGAIARSQSNWCRYVSRYSLYCRLHSISPHYLAGSKHLFLLLDVEIDGLLVVMLNSSSFFLCIFCFDFITAPFD